MGETWTVETSWFSLQNMALTPNAFVRVGLLKTFPRASGLEAAAPDRGIAMIIVIETTKDEAGVVAGIGIVVKVEAVV